MTTSATVTALDNLTDLESNLSSGSYHYWSCLFAVARAKSSVAESQNVCKFCRLMFRLKPIRLELPTARVTLLLVVER